MLIFVQLSGSSYPLLSLHSTIDGNSLLKIEERLSVTNYSSKNNLPTFRLNAAVVIRAKWRLEHSVETSASDFPSYS